MFLNLAERDPAILLSSLYEALREDTDKVTLELLGPGIMLHETALMLFKVLRNRPTHIHIHAIFMKSLLVLVGTPSCFTSSQRAITRPSLLLRMASGLPIKRGLKTRSQQA